MKRICTTGHPVNDDVACGRVNTQVTLNSVRIGANDRGALGTFYQAATGMQRPTGSMRPDDEVEFL
jgi:hypothetical protein